MFIWDPKAKELFQPQFYCPKCNDVRPYQAKQVAKDFAFCFIPLFETENRGQCIECQVCKSGFDPKVLLPSNQSLCKLVGAARYELLHKSAEELSSELIGIGLKERLVDKLFNLTKIG